MLKVYSAALVGLSAEVVEVEVDISAGLPATIVVGLPDAAVQESRERVRSAIKNSNAAYPRSRVAVNLAPADIRKNGSCYDLPIALSILLNSRQIEFAPDDCLIVGELALDGAVRPIVGLLPMLLMAKQKKFKRIVIPAANQTEASLVTGIEVIPVESLIQAIGYLQGLLKIEPLEPIRWETIFQEPAKDALDFKHINGQDGAKRALEVAAAGGHNVMLSGPPGTGKTLLAKALPSILPKMSVDEILEITKIYSIAGLLSPSKSLITSRPFRSPHHSASAISLVGGGSSAKPGEVSLAHRGVLFMDELPEFQRAALENLRQPLEEGRVTVARSSSTVTYPAQFILISAQNPCPCGYFNSAQKCVCSASQIMNYQRRVSGPLMDRVDIFVEVGRVEYDKLSTNGHSESSSSVQERVQLARSIQLKRFAGRKIITNAEMGIREVREFCRLELDQRMFMREAATKLSLSARAYHRVLKLARTIADLSESPDISVKHLAEAIQYRTKAE